MDKNAKLDSSFSQATLWRQEAIDLRAVLLACGLAEELKWGKPCYTHDGRNICLIQRMKGFLALLFFKGALLDDPDGILEPQGPNSRQDYRARFTSTGDVARMAGSIQACVRQAIAVNSTGLKVRKAAELAYPDELLQTFDEDPAFKDAFEALTPGRRRGYLLHFAGAKKSATRAARIERYRQDILGGRGLHDRG